MRCKNNPIMSLLSLIFALALLSIASAQAPESGGSDPELVDIVQPGSPMFEKRTESKCRNDLFRELDGTCTNDNSDQAKLFGSTGRPQFSYFGRSGKSVNFDSQISPREISNVVFSQSGNVWNKCGVSEMAVFFGQFVDHTFAASPESEDEHPIKKSSKPDPVGDKFLDEMGFPDGFPFSRSRRVRVKEGGSAERASNVLTSACDLVNVYGTTKERSSGLRTGPFPKRTRGEMKTSHGGNLLPMNNERLTNAPTTKNTFFVAGDHRSNENPVLASIHTLFVKEHNRLAKGLREDESLARLNDLDIYNYAKRINEIQFQKIL